MGVPRVAGTGSTLGKGGLSAPIPVLRPGYRVIAERRSFSTNVYVLGSGRLCTGARNSTNPVGWTNTTDTISYRCSRIYTRCRPI